MCDVLCTYLESILHRIVFTLADTCIYLVLLDVEFFLLIDLLRLYRNINTTGKFSFMNLLSTQTIRETLSRLAQEIESLSKNSSGLEQCIGMSRRKNALLLKDVQELRRRKEDQTNLLNREENKIYSHARTLSETEDQINQMEVELSDMQTQKAKLQEEVNSRIETIKESELILGLYEGCLALFK